MGRYLDIAKQSEARRRAGTPSIRPSQRSISPSSQPPDEAVPPNGHIRQRLFLPRPLGQEAALDVRDCWSGLFDWLIEHHPAHFHAVCEAEEQIRTLERAGMTAGPEHEAACHELLIRFETARRLKLRESVRIWMQ